MNQYKLELPAPGSKCFIGPASTEQIEGILVGVCISEAQGNDFYLQFHVSWWNGRARVCEWLEPREVRFVKGEHQQLSVGFINGGKQ